jgi:hypothetical protein
MSRGSAAIAGCVLVQENGESLANRWKEITRLKASARKPAKWNEVLKLKELGMGRRETGTAPSYKLPNPMPFSSE